MERRLTVILATDVVGYSRLIGSDERGTLDALRSLRTDVIEPALEQQNGRLVKLMGDGLLAEFASVIDAVSAALDIQQEASKRAQEIPEDRRIELRVGVNVGDVAVEDGDIFGDAVNIAARLQEISAPNGIAVSEAVHREFRGKLDVTFEDVGPHILTPIPQIDHRFGDITG